MDVGQSCGYIIITFISVYYVAFERRVSVTC